MRFTGTLDINSRICRLLCKWMLSDAPPTAFDRSRHCLCHFGGPDVVVHAEEIRRVEFVFQGNEAIIIAAVSFASDGVPFVRHVVPVSPGDKKGLQGFPALARPSDILFGFGRIGPNGPGKEIPRVLPMWERRISRSDTRGRAVPVFDAWSKSAGRRGLSHKLGEILDDIISQATQKV